jgi:hypothetical protein
LVFAALPVLFVVGGPLSPLFMPGAMVIAYLLDRERPSRVGSTVMLGAGVLWLACTVTFWWLWGVGFDAADANQPPPAVMGWYAPSFMVGLGAFITFWVTFAVSVIRRSHERAQRPRTSDLSGST